MSTYTYSKQDWGRFSPFLVCTLILKKRYSFWSSRIHRTHNTYHRECPCGTQYKGSAPEHGWTEDVVHEPNLRNLTPNYLFLMDSSPKVTLMMLQLGSQPSPTTPSKWDWLIPRWFHLCMFLVCFRIYWLFLFCMPSLLECSTEEGRGTSCGLGVIFSLSGAWLNIEKALHGYA